jgi:alpha-mannosidase
MGHTNDWRSGQSAWGAARLNQRLQAFQTAPHAGLWGRSFSLLTCNNSNVMVKAIKKAEASNEVIVRLQELTGHAQTAQLTCVSPITAARQVTGAEDPIATLTPAGGSLTVSR